MVTFMLSTLPANNNSADFAARARASWERGIATEADAAGPNMSLEEYRTHKADMFRKVAELKQQAAARGETWFADSSVFTSATDAIAQGRDAIANLHEHANAINGVAAHLDPRNLKQLATLFGQEWADDYRARLEQGRERAIDLLGVKQQQIGERFAVLGSLVQRDDDGSFTLGAFALQAEGAGFSVRIGSDGTAAGSPAAPPPASLPATPAKPPAEPPIDLRA